MFPAGIPVADRHALELATMLRTAGQENTAARLENGYERQTRILALSIAERDEILNVLVDCPEPLCELRATLLQEHEWRVREGIS
jgi:hypothetical protein